MRPGLISPHFLGAPLLAGGFVGQRFGLVTLGGGLVAVGVAFFSTNVIATFARSTRRDAIGWSLPSAAGWLALTVAAGLALAVAKLGMRLPVSPLALLRAHAHLGLVGTAV